MKRSVADLNLFESLLADLRRPEMPPHAGEAFFLWTYNMAVRECRAVLLVMCNHTVDRALLETLEHFIADVLEPQIKRLEGLMREEGVVQTTVTPDPPRANAMEIPAGARLTDSQIARMLVVKVEGMLDLTYNGMRFSQRSDVAAMFMAFMNQVSAQGYTLRETMIQRGWFPQPPTFGDGGRAPR